MSSHVFQFCGRRRVRITSDHRRLAGCVRIPKAENICRRLEGKNGVLPFEGKRHRLVPTRIVPCGELNQGHRRSLASREAQDTAS
jgi:hypothetical protein